MAGANRRRWRDSTLAPGGTRESRSPEAGEAAAAGIARVIRRGQLAEVDSTDIALNVAKKRRYKKDLKGGGASVGD